MHMPSLPALPGFRPRIRAGIAEFPVHHMRGGTSTGLVLWTPFVPADTALREELLRHLMGVPQTGQYKGNRQITGLGRGPATSNKVFLADIEHVPDGPQLVSTLAQLTSDHADIDWRVNCGNMSAALPLWAIDAGLAQGGELKIRNTNTGIVTTARMKRQADGHYEMAEIPGVDGAYPAVDLFLHRPVGAKTGKLLPTGRAQDDIAGHRVSCVDVAVPMVIVDAAGFGKTGHETMAELDADASFMQALREVWVEAGLRMGLANAAGTPMSAEELRHSETVPKVCIVGAPRAGGHIAVRYFTPQSGHASLAVSGGCCLAATTLVPGTVANQLAQGLGALGTRDTDINVAIENPAGILEATVCARMDGNAPLIHGAAYRRSAQILLRGHVPLYRASADLMRALARLA